ncbi:hypothetical protein GOV09_00590 [Candidatus Woesearchaeota archaeon]|nr:hypothetical protein [Candidatus Woesearchaeota archaeon]
MGLVTVILAIALGGAPADKPSVEPFQGSPIQDPEPKPLTYSPMNALPVDNRFLCYLRGEKRYLGNLDQKGKSNSGRTQRIDGWIGYG